MADATLMDATGMSSEEELRLLVHMFEAGTLPKARWTHAAHVAMGCHYVFLLSEDRAMAVMRQRVRAYNEAVGAINSATSGYHETLTRFWITVLARWEQLHPSTSAWECVLRGVALYGSRRDLHVACYDFDVVKSTEARREWIAPNRWPTDSRI